MRNPHCLLRLLRQRQTGHRSAGGVRCAVRPFAGGGQHRVPRAGKGRQRPRLRPQSAGRGSHGCRHRPEALSDPDRQKRHRYPVWLPRRGGRGVQGLYGAGGSVVRAGRGADVAPRRQQRGGHRLHQLLHPDDLHVPRAGVPGIHRAGAGTQRAGRSGADECGRAVPAGAHAPRRTDTLLHSGRRRRKPQRGAAPGQRPVHDPLQLR